MSYFSSSVFAQLRSGLLRDALWHATPPALLVLRLTPSPHRAVSDAFPELNREAGQEVFGLRMRVCLTVLTPDTQVLARGDISREPAEPH